MNNEKKSDKIHIRELSIRCIIGINEDERREKQDVQLNLTLYADFKKACKTDNINDAVDYKVLKKEIIGFVENSSFFLIEKLAEEIANICLGHDGVKRVDVILDKPGALRFAKSVAVEITRYKND